MKSLFTKENALHLIRELAWLALTCLMVVAILNPITTKIDFIYWRITALFIFLTITFFRYTVTFKSLPFFRPPAVRFIFFAVNLSLFIYLMGKERDLLGLYDNFYTEDFGFPKIILYDNVKENLFKYIYRVITIFGTGSLAMLVAFQCRLILSYWQYYKHQSDTLMES